MLTKHYRNFFIIRDIVVEDEGYLCSDKVIMKYYGRHYMDRIGK
ncbi:putative iron-only hydrogenase system regulator [Klebsiella phage vB_KpnM_IME346]|uniref:Putative iron-only hydrogenase system regulator n=1 Tax=Klebsiella phage vB_KpnM_IME346 TaxID=2562174 RepID=A0A4D6DRK3_9CAUD|nr:putative iron-only hydrogenase system regulator [Klebsiella phage vB_KpnM_IME346]QBZ68930.1 putative iron-only hydrogenase system regulator [Klebsiella phage vB_KpnM_IME346]